MRMVHLPLLFFFTAGCVVGNPPTTVRAEGACTARGILTAVDASRRTIVAEIPSAGKNRTVGGKVSPQAQVSTGAVAAALDAFHAGDAVQIGWDHGRQGHTITCLTKSERAEIPPAQTSRPPQPMPGKVIGSPRIHTVQHRETLLDIARKYGLGFNEMKDLYPDVDVWIPPEGMELVIPSQWILPEAATRGILINVAELRLYYFPGNDRPVSTYPLGIGDTDFTTPLGRFRIQDKRTRPTWYIPESLQGKYGVKSVPPGPENPLGDHWMGIGNSYGIHGTDIAWSVGRLVTHGCIRMYPEDIQVFYPEVATGTPVTIIYEPVKIGLSSGRVFAEVHRDVYNRIPDFVAYGHARLTEAGLLGRVDPDRYRRALERRDGMPVDVTADLVSAK